MEIELKAQKAIIKTQEDKNNLSGKIKMKSEGILAELNEAFQAQSEKIKKDAEKDLDLQMNCLKVSKETCLEAMAREYDENHLQWEDEIFAGVIGRNLAQ